MAEAPLRVARGASVGALGGAALAAAVGRLAAALPPPTPGSQVAFAFDRDRAAFAAALLAVWRRGHCAVLPVSARRRHVAPALAQPATVLLLHDTGAGLGLDVPRLLAAAAESAPAPAPDALAVTGPLALVAADGSTRRLGPAALAHDVARAIAELALGPGQVVANRCAPGQPEALVAGLLAPLAAGAAVVDSDDTAALVVVPRACAAVPVPPGARVVAIDLAPEPPPASSPRRPLRFERLPGPGDALARYRATVPADWFGFAGHFPGYPVLSGAVQLHEVVLPCLAATLGPVAVAAFHDMKFLARIAPGDTIEVVIRRGAAPDRPEFELLRGQTKCSTGRLSLRPAAEAAS